MIPASSIRDAVHEIGYRLSCSPAALSLVEALTIITERRLQSFDSFRIGFVYAYCANRMSESSNVGIVLSIIDQLVVNRERLME